MKVACTHCEKVSEQDGAFGWVRVDGFGPDLSSWGDRCQGVYCGPGCVVSHLERVMGASTRG